MAVRKALVIGSDGRPQQLQTGDVLGGPFSENDTYPLTNADSGSHLLGTVVYIFSADNAKKAMANASGTKEAIAIATATIAAGAVGTYQTGGVITGLSGLTAGAPYFLDPATAGGMTATVPTSTGQWVVELGMAISATEFLIRVREPIAL